MEKLQLLKAARDGLSDAIAEDFNAKFGVNVNDPVPWRKLSKVIGIQPFSYEMPACRIVSSTFKSYLGTTLKY